MARYLSPDWLASLRAVAAEAQTRDTARITVQQVVVGGPEGDVRYALRVAGGRIDVVAGDVPGADVVITESYETAVALWRRDLGAAAAVLAGLVHVTGDVSLLLAHQDALAELDGHLDRLRDSTELLPA